MKGSHSVSSGPAQQDDSWTCQHCGWVYPNAHPSAKHRRNHKKQCGKIKGFESRSNLPKGGSSDEASSGDDSHTQKAIEAGSAGEHANAPQSRDLLLTDINVPDNVKSHAPVLQGVPASLDVKPEAADHRDIISIDTVKTESPAPEPEPNIVSLDKTTNTSEEGKVNRVEAAVRDLPGVDSEQANSAGNEGAKSEGYPPKHTESIASLKEPSKTLQDESKVTLTPCLDKVEMTPHESQGLDSDHAKVKESLSISKEHGLNRQGSSQGDDSWTCRRCGWVYPNPHPSAKHRKKHKKQCGKMKGFELHTEPHNGSSSDEISSDEDVHVKKEHVQHQPPQLLQAQEQVDETVATASLPSIVDRPAISVEREIITESASNSLQPKEFSKQVDAPDEKLQDTPNMKDISTPFMIPSVVPELPQNVLSLDQQNVPAGDIKKDAVALEQAMKVSCVSDELDTLSTKESPKHLSMKEETLPNPEHVQHQPPQLSQAQEQADETVATESLPSIVDRPAISVEREIITESVSNSLQPKEFSAKVDAPAGERQDTPNMKDISTPFMIPSAVPELPQNVLSLDQQNLPAGDIKKDAIALDQVMKVSCVSDEQDTSLPKHLSMKEETLPNPAIAQEIFESSETQLNAVPSLSKSLDTLASEDRGDLGKATHVEHGSTTRIAEEPAGLSREWTPNVTSILSVSDLKSSNTSPPPYFEDKGASILKGDEASAVVMDPRGLGLSNEALNTSAGEGLNQSVILKEEIDVSEKPGLTGLDTASNLDALDDTMVKDPLRKVSSGTLPADKVPVENKPVTENLLPQTALSTAGLANDANEEERFLSVQTSVNPVQLVPNNELMTQIVGGGNDDAFLSTMDKTDETPSVTNVEDNQTASVGVAEVDVPKEVSIPAVTTGEAVSSSTGRSDGQLEPENISSDLSSCTLPADKVPVENKSVTENLLPLAALSTDPVQLVPKNELLAQIVEGGNDDEFLSTIDKTDEIPPVTNMEHLLDDQTASVGVAEVDVPKEITIPAVKTGEAISIQKSLDEFVSKNVSSVSEDSDQGETARDTENTNSTICIVKDTGVAGIAKENEVEGIAEGIVHVKDGEEEKTEASGILEAMAKPEANEESPFERGGIGSSDSSYAETYSFTRSESGVTGRSELGTSSHKLSDSLEIYEDAQDSLETCSVGGSVEENESLDEPRQALDRLQEEPKHLGAASLDERVPGENVSVEQKPSVSNGSGSKLGEASFEEKAPTLSGTSYGGRNEMADLKAPSPEAWQEPGPSNLKSEGKKISTSEVTEDSKSGESHTALRNLMAKEGPGKADPIVETSTVAGDLKSLNRKDGSLASANGTKPKSRSFWRHCICCSAVH